MRSARLAQSPRFGYSVLAATFVVVPLPGPTGSTQGIAMRSKDPIGSDTYHTSPIATGIDGKPITIGDTIDGCVPSNRHELTIDGRTPRRLNEIMNQAVSHSPKLTVKSGGKLSVELPVTQSAGFQTRVLSRLRTPEEVAAGVNSPTAMPSAPRDLGPSSRMRALRTQLESEEPSFVGQDENVELNAVHRFRLEPDDGQPVEFIGSLIARALLDRSDTQRTWAGLYKTRGGKVISEIVRDDGRARNVAADLGDRLRSVKVFDSVEAALASIRSAALRNQLLRDLGMLETKFIE
jgi:hypothetical protein